MPESPARLVAGASEAFVEPSESLWHQAGCFILLLLALHLVAGPVLHLSTWRVDYTVNPMFQEALAWKNGSLALPTREKDTALFGEKIYSVHPPLFTFMSLAALALGSLQGVPADQFFPPWYVLAVVLPLPLAGFWAFQQVIKRAAWSAVMTGLWLVGTPMLPSLVDAQNGGVNALNHVLANVGLMLIAGDLLGRRRMWPACAGIVIAMWSRPHLGVFALAATWIAFRTLPEQRRRAGVVAVMAATALAAGALLLLNYLKFGNPLESGYRYIYDYRPDSWLGRRFYAHGIFSPHFLGENAWAMNLALPKLRLTSEFLTPANDEWGASIWSTMPIMLALIVYARSWWGDRSARTLMLASLIAIAVGLTYHSRGASTRGYYAYSLDYVAVWLLVIAPWCMQPRHRWIMLACLAWSAFYFNLISR